MTDPSATLRQQRRRKRLKEQKARIIPVLLTKEQDAHLGVLLEAKYAPDQSSVLAKALDEAYSHHTAGATKTSEEESG